MRAVHTVLVLALLLAGLGAGSPAAASGSLAADFGALPGVWGASLSPDGSRISFLKMHESGVPIAVVFDRSTGRLNMLIASKKDDFDLSRCWWANHERLLCSFLGIVKDRGHRYETTRLVAVDWTGKQMKVLMQGRLRGSFAQHQDRVIDLLPSDPKRVLIQMPDDAASGISSLDIYSGSTKRVIRPRDHVRAWISDGHGTPRLRFSMSDSFVRWDYRLHDDNRWKKLPVSEEQETEGYHPIGFGSDPNKLLVFKSDGGRLSLFSEDLTQDRASKLIYSHPDVDLAGYHRLGKHQRLVGAYYATDRPHMEYFDESLEALSERLARALPGQTIEFVGESWDQRLYLIHASSDRDPGSYYMLDLESNECKRLAEKRPSLSGRSLATMTPIRYTASDGAEVPAYLTLPGPESDGPFPTVVLPHGGPQSRDVWRFDWLTQFFVASGFAVLQSNFRGSGGYGRSWVGDGGFKAWKLVVSDLEAGARSLVERGIADPDRMCIVGWSYGGYAALMSTIKHPERYRCAVSIAGVTDPQLLIEQLRYYIRGRAAAADMIGRDSEVLKEGSPRRRAAEIRVPILLFHGDEDVNVSVEHSRKLARDLRKKNKSVEYYEYDDAEHDLWRNEYRIDMLERLDRFLHRHLDPGTTTPIQTGQIAR